MFSISCSGIMAPSKNCWPFDCDVSFDQVKRELVIDPSKPIPSHLGPKDLPFESRVIAHIIATTLLPRAGSHSTLSQHNTLFAYYLVFNVKVHISSFIIFAMTVVIYDPTSLPFGMLLTRIFESHFMCLGDFSLVLIKQRYNSHTFLSMGFTHSVSSWTLKNDSEDLSAKNVKSKPSSSTSVLSVKLNVALENLAEMNAKLYTMSISVTQVSDVMTKLTVMGKQVDSLKDLLLASHFKIDNVKDVFKESGVDVARIRLRIDQIVKEAIKIATKVQADLRKCLFLASLLILCLSCFYFAIVICVVLLILILCGFIVVFVGLYVLSFLLMPKRENYYLLLHSYYLLLLLYCCCCLLLIVVFCCLCYFFTS
ncbi:hypothetical protein R3W88_023051 [Solanum pinnatisectum]|uniref:Uncharacterized protein n=1 Tax=Solanum pinnatisectum TaxID=50273 RepID=A0AAV9LXD1_9SOLN|nr:hypothetical protein R3W88_023051 [Solanum pinnatisectum]